MTTWQQQSLEKFQQQLPGAPVEWLSALQAKHLARFCQRGFPNRKQEFWKYTDVSAIAKQDFQLPAAHALAAETLTALTDAFVVTLINGELSEQHSRLQDLPAGAIVCDFKTALSQHADLLHTYLPASMHAFAEQKPYVFADLNAALLQQVMMIYVPEQLVLDKPIHILHINGSEQAVCMQQCRHLIIAEAGASCQVVEEYRGQHQNTYFNNLVTYIQAQAGARVEHYKIQQESANAYHVANILVQQQQGSSVMLHNYSLGAKLARDNLTLQLLAEHAGCEFYGFYHLQNKQHVDHHTLVDHISPHTQSRQLYKGIMDGQSHAVFNGAVKVHPHAQKIKAQQTNNNILLSKHAQIDSKPQLEIYADDVQCSHGATIGQLDEEALFYLRSRGIGEAAAQHLLACAFSDEIFSAISDKKISQYVQKQTVARLATSGCQGECVHES